MKTWILKRRRRRSWVKSRTVPPTFAERYFWLALALIGALALAYTVLSRLPVKAG